MDKPMGSDEIRVAWNKVAPGMNAPSREVISGWATKACNGPDYVPACDHRDVAQMAIWEFFAARTRSLVLTLNRSQLQ